MKILLADSDRDMLGSYKKILEYSFGEVVTAFDGTQAVMQLAKHKFDIVILNMSLPRVDGSQIVKMLNEDGIPVIVLLNNDVTSGVLLSDILANSYMKLPFYPDELKEKIKEIIEKKHSKEKLCFFDIEIIISKFKSTDGIRFTNEEINILKTLSAGKTFEAGKVSSYINSLNNKFVRQKKSCRIKYVISEGYRLVNENE